MAKQSSTTLTCPICPSPLALLPHEENLVSQTCAMDAAEIQTLTIALSLLQLELQARKMQLAETVGSRRQISADQRRTERRQELSILFRTRQD